MRSICFIFLLCMVSNALEKSTSDVRGFLHEHLLELDGQSKFMMLWIDFSEKPFWFFLSIFFNFRFYAVA